MTDKQDGGVASTSKLGHIAAAKQEREEEEGNKGSKGVDSTVLEVVLKVVVDYYQRTRKRE